MTTVAETVSRVRNVMKAVKEDAFVTDRFLYSLILKYAKAFMYQQKEMDKLKSFEMMFSSLNCVELIEVDKVEACCSGVRTHCTIMRTKDKIPTPMQGPSGMLIRDVTSIDGSQQIHRTKPRIYTSMTKSTNFKYNKRKYYWYLNDYLYFPNIEWEAVRLDGVWENEIFGLNCGDDYEDESCKPWQEQESHISEELYAQIEQSVLQELGIKVQLPPDEGDNKQTVHR
jgi:hypothetical protein